MACVLRLHLCIIFVLNFAGTVLAVSGPDCLSCAAVALPEQCRHVTRCREGQQCYSQRILHDDRGVFYKLGCMTPQACEFYSVHAQRSDFGKRAGSDYLQCSQCCRDHFCNHKMCTVTNAASGFLNCVECGPTNDTANGCHISTCRLDQQCYINLETDPKRGSIVYDMGCRNTSECANHTHSGCTRCTNTSYSNMHACDDDS